MRRLSSSSSPDSDRERPDFLLALLRVGRERLRREPADESEAELELTAEDSEEEEESDSEPLSDPEELSPPPEPSALASESDAVDRDVCLLACLGALALGAGRGRRCGCSASSSESSS